MKAIIRLKSEKSGVSEKGAWKILSLLCSVDNKDDANLLAQHGVQSGVPIEEIEKLIKKNEYNGNITYQFNLQCHSFTFDRVEKYGTIDISPENIIVKYDGRYVNCRIKVVLGVEQINGYSAPKPIEEEAVTGWTVPAPEPVQNSAAPTSSIEEQMNTAFSDDTKNLPPIIGGITGNDLPF